MALHQPFTREEFRSIYSKVPRLTVEVIIYNQQNGVLLTLRKNGPYDGLWHIPGGTVYFNEPVEDAVRRVAQEELGVDVDIKNFLGYIEYFSGQKKGGFDYAVGLAFACETSAESFRLDENAQRAKYFTINSLPENMVNEQHIFLTKHVSKLSKSI